MILQEAAAHRADSRAIGQVNLAGWRPDQFDPRLVLREVGVVKLRRTFVAKIVVLAAAGDAEQEVDIRQVAGQILVTVGVLAVELRLRDRRALKDPLAVSTCWSVSLAAWRIMTLPSGVLQSYACESGRFSYGFTL